MDFTGKDFTSSAWAASVGCWGSPSRLPLTHTSANPTMNQQKKPRHGSGAREIREIITISAMKPLQTLKGSTQSAHHLRRLAGLDPLPKIAAEPEGGTDAKKGQGGGGGHLVNIDAFSFTPTAIIRKSARVVRRFRKYFGDHRWKRLKKAVENIKQIW